MAMGLAFVGGLRDSEFKRWLHDQVYTVSFQILGGALSVVITYHNPSNRPPKQGICVANHTSPIDVLVLACDNAYALVRIICENPACFTVFPPACLDWAKTLWVSGQHAKYFVPGNVSYMV